MHVKKSLRKITEWIQSDHGNQEMTQKQMTVDRSRASEVLVAVDQSSHEKLSSQGAPQDPPAGTAAGSGQGGKRSAYEPALLTC